MNKKQKHIGTNKQRQIKMYEKEPKYAYKIIILFNIFLDFFLYKCFLGFLNVLQLFSDSFEVFFL